MLDVQKKLAIATAKKDIETLQKMQDLGYFESVNIGSSKRVMRVVGGWIYDNINTQKLDPNPNFNSVFVSDADANLTFNINRLKSML